MSDTAIPTTGGESNNDWFACVRHKYCGHIGVHPNGLDEFCPTCEVTSGTKPRGTQPPTTCRSGLERYAGGRIWECDDCGTEYVAKGDAENCC